MSVIPALGRPRQFEAILDNTDDPFSKQKPKTTKSNNPPPYRYKIVSYILLALNISLDEIQQF